MQQARTQGSCESRQQAARSAGPLAVLGWMVPLGVAVVAFVATLAGPEAPLRANGESTDDTDGDGLNNVLEAGLAISPDLVDSDGDGWNDAEEMARKSLPHVHSSVPESAVASVGMQACMLQAKLNVSAAVYLPSASLSETELEFGVYAAGRWVPLPASSYASSLTFATVPTREPGQALVVVSAILPTFPLNRTGAMSVYARLRVEGSVASAAVLNLVLRQLVPMQILTPAEVSPLAEELLGTGLLYRPLGGSQVPSTWTSGEICFQRLESVGTHGAVVTQEVTSASCISGWDGYCDSGSCSASVGTTVDLVDPSALVGG